MTHPASSPKSISRSLISTSCTKSCRRNIYEDHKAPMGRNVNLFICGHQIFLQENTTSALKTQRFVKDHSWMWKVQYNQNYQCLLQLDINRISTRQILRWLLDVALEDAFAWWRVQNPSIHHFSFFRQKEPQLSSKACNVPHDKQHWLSNSSLIKKPTPLRLHSVKTCLLKKPFYFRYQKQFISVEPHRLVP